MRREILAALAEASASARVIVLTSAGRGFCAGQDLNDAKGLECLEFDRTLHEEYEPMLNAIHECPVPTIAAANGPAAGAGASLALAADVVIATRSADFLQAFSRIALIPDAGGTYWLPRQIAFARAMGAVLFAEPVRAEQATAWGMIWQAVPDEDFAATVLARAAQLAKGPTTTYRLAKQALRQPRDPQNDARPLPADQEPAGQLQSKETRILLTGIKGRSGGSAHPDDSRSGGRESCPRR